MHCHASILTIRGPLDPLLDRFFDFLFSSS